MDNHRKAALQPGTDETQTRLSNSVEALSPIHPAPDSRLAQRAHLAPHLLSSRDIRYLQRTVGNHAVARILHRSSPTSAPPPAPVVTSTPGPRVQRFGKRLGRALSAPFRWLGKKISRTGNSNKDRFTSDESDEDPFPILTQQPTNARSNMEDFRITFLAEPMDPNEAKDTLTRWLEEVKTALEANDLDPTTRKHLEASERTIGPMIGMVPESNNEIYRHNSIGDRQVWRTGVQSKGKIDTQAIAIVSGNRREVTVSYIATAPINLYGEEQERTKGSGTALMLTIIRKAQDTGASVVLMADPDAIPYYQRLGFRGKGHRPTDEATWEMELTPDRFDVAEDYLRKNSIGIDAPNILKAAQIIDWEALDGKKSKKKKNKS